MRRLQPQPRPVSGDAPSPICSSETILRRVASRSDVSYFAEDTLASSAACSNCISGFLAMASTVETMRSMGRITRLSASRVNRMAPTLRTWGAWGRGGGRAARDRSVGARGGGAWGVHHQDEEGLEDVHERLERRSAA